MSLNRGKNRGGETLWRFCVRIGVRIERKHWIAEKGKKISHTHTHTYTHTHTKSHRGRLSSVAAVWEHSRLIYFVWSAAALREKFTEKRKKRGLREAERQTEWSRQWRREEARQRDRWEGETKGKSSGFIWCGGGSVALPVQLLHLDETFF